MSACAAFDPAGPYAGQMLVLADCQALAMAREGYQALAGGAGALAGLLAVFVALLGYRLMLGQGPSLGEGAGLVARVAMVMALATQWPAYQALVFDVAMGAPRALAGALAGAGGSGSVEAGAQAARVDALVAQATVMVAAVPAPAPVPSRPGWRPSPAAAAPGLPDAVKGPVHWASALLTVTVLGGWFSTRLVAGVLLGLGPLLAGGLLFAGTRGLALGWMRVLAGAALGQVAVAVVVAMELGLAEAQMAGLLQALGGGAPSVVIGGAAVAMADGLLATTMVFAVVMLGALAGVARVAAGLAWPEAWRGIRPSLPAREPNVPPMPVISRDRAASMHRVTRIAAAARAMDRREAMRATTTENRTQLALMPGPAAQARDGAGGVILRLGQGARRGAPRPSRQAAQRDANP